MRLRETAIITTKKSSRSLFKMQVIRAHSETMRKLPKHWRLRAVSSMSSLIVLSTILANSFLLLLLLLLAPRATNTCDAREITNSRNTAQEVGRLSFLDPTILDSSRLYESSLGTIPIHSSRGLRQKRAAPSSASTSPQQKFVDACQSKMEVLTPYYATNNKGKLRAIVNSELMQQAIQVETCLRPTNHPNQAVNSKCNSQPECGCEQKYKWHRLLVMDANETNGVGAASRGLFMDWFLFPSNCVCRCRTPTIASTRHFLKTVINSSAQQANSKSTATF